MPLLVDGLIEGGGHGAVFAAEVVPALLPPELFESVEVECLLGLGDGRGVVNAGLVESVFRLLRDQREVLGVRGFHGLHLFGGDFAVGEGNKFPWATVEKPSSSVW
ncbi:MAG: hypothetical protein IPL39_18885 [Opitutaceae bacterium]|nr:hypothetical protein [Opitutaceae bacterium]